jgi:hypothetical protein
MPVKVAVISWQPPQQNRKSSSQLFLPFHRSENGIHHYLFGFQGRARLFLGAQIYRIHCAPTFGAGHPAQPNVDSLSVGIPLIYPMQ